MTEKDLLKYKILLLGPPAVGKTSLWHRFINKTFEENYAMTIGVQVSTKDVTFRNAVVKLSVWDVGGQIRFEKLRKNFYNGAQGALLIFDLTRKETFSQLEDWINEVNSYLGYKIPFMLIGNKNDLKAAKKFKTKEVEQFAKAQDSIYLETSAKTGDGVKIAFKELIISLVKKHQISLKI